MLTVRASLTLFHRDFAKGDLITSSRAKETLENQTRNRSEWKIGAKSVDGSRLVKSGYLSHRTKRPIRILIGVLIIMFYHTV